MRTSARHELRVAAARPTRVEAHTFDYPGWRVRIDDETIVHQTLERNGTIAFDLPAGRHTIELELEPTPLRRRAYLVSGSTFAALLGASLVSLRRRRSTAS